MLASHPGLILAGILTVLVGGITGCGTSVPSTDAVLAQCGNRSNSDSSGACELTYSNCTDGRTYVVKCTESGRCECLVDGVATGDFSSSESNLCKMPGAEQDQQVSSECPSFPR